MIGIESLKGSENKEIKKVRINPIPKIHIIDYNSEDKTDTNDIDAVIQNKCTKSFMLFYSNITSFGQHAKDYLFSLPNEVKCLCLAEMHKSPEIVNAEFSKRSYECSYSPLKHRMSQVTMGEKL